MISNIYEKGTYCCCDILCTKLTPWRWNIFFSKIYV